jgi:ankyrin repeat protein
MDQKTINKNIQILISTNIPLSEKLDKIGRCEKLRPAKVPQGFVLDEDLKSPIDRPKLWVSRIKKTKKSKTSRETIKKIIDNINKEGQSLLHQASYYGEVAIIKKLLKEGANINQEDWYGSTPLLYAIRANQIKAVRELMTFKDLNINQKYGNKHETVLIKAIDLGYIDIATEICYRNKAIVSKQDIDGRTPLFHAVVKGCSEIVLELLKAGSKEKDLIDYKGFNAIYLAIDNGEVNSVKILLDHSNFDISAEICKKLVIIGCYGNKIELVRSSLSRVPITEPIREEGLSPILISYSLHFTSLTYELIKISLNEEIDFVSNQGEFLLIAACRNNDIEMVKFLVDMDLNFNLKNSSQSTALHEASFRGFIRIVQTLLTRCVNLNAVDVLGNTPLMLATKANHCEVVELLVRRGADLKITDFKGKNVYFYATKEITEVFNRLLTAKRTSVLRKFNRILIPDKNYISTPKIEILKLGPSKL